MQVVSKLIDGQHTNYFNEDPFQINFIADSNRIKQIRFFLYLFPSLNSFRKSVVRSWDGKNLCTWTLKNGNAEIILSPNQNGLMELWFNLFSFSTHFLHKTCRDGTVEQFQYRNRQFSHFHFVRVYSIGR